MKYSFYCLSTFIFNVMIKQTLHYTFLRMHSIPFCDFHHCIVRRVAEIQIFEKNLPHRPKE